MNLSNVDWISAASPPYLLNEDVHIWRVDLSEFGNKKADMFNLLSADEQQRAGKYHFEKDSSLFIIGRGVLRILLGHYLGMRPEQLCFKYNTNGKPNLDIENGAVSISFNASFSNGIQVIAITLDTSVGIDIEFVDDEFPIFDIADRYYSTDEVSAIRDMSPDLQTIVFFNCWTQKEAYVKAIGEGLSHPLPKLAISSDIEDPNSFLIKADPDETKGWIITSVFSVPDHVISLAYEGMPKTIRYLKWPAIAS